MGCHRPDPVGLLGVGPFHGNLEPGGRDLMSLTETHRVISDTGPKRGDKHLDRGDPLVLSAFFQRLVYDEAVLARLDRQPDTSDPGDRHRLLLGLNGYRHETS